MRTNVSKLALIGLQGSLGLMVLAEAALLAFAPLQISAFGKTGLPEWVRIVLAWSEMLSAGLFLLPRATKVGGRGLLLTLLFAAGIHVHHRPIDVGTLIVYAAAVLVVMSAKQLDPERTNQGLHK